MRRTITDAVCALLIIIAFFYSMHLFEEAEEAEFRIMACQKAPHLPECQPPTLKE